MTADRMTAAEAVVLCRFAKACCPQQAFDAYTPDAWFELLRDLLFEDCKIALTRVVKAKPFVSPAEIREAVKALRWERMVAFDKACSLEPPAHLADDPRAEIEWRRRIDLRVMDGEITHPDQVDERGELKPRDMASLGQIGRTVPDA